MRSRFSLLLVLLSTQLCFPQRSGNLSGHVREERTNVPVESVALEVLSSGTRAAAPVMSGMDGEFQFPYLKDGDYYIVASKGGYDTVTIPVSILAGSAAPVLINLPRHDAKAPSGAGDSVSARELSIPDKARAWLKRENSCFTRNPSRKNRSPNSGARSISSPPIMKHIYKSALRITGWQNMWKQKTICSSRLSSARENTLTRCFCWRKCSMTNNDLSMPSPWPGTQLPRATHPGTAPSSWRERWWD